MTYIKLRAWLIALSMCVAAITVPAAAQGMREVTIVPADCRTVLPPGVRGTVQPWQVYVQLEHCDRIKRLKRLADILPPDKRPIFYEGIVPASRLPANFGVDMPVLRVVFPERTFFDTARSALLPEAEAVAAIVSADLGNEPPDVALFIAGHADSRGNRTMNEALSIDRANALAESVVRKGAFFSSVWRIGFGEDMPLISGTTTYAYDRNRRVEFLFAAKPEAVAIWLADQQLDETCQGRTRAEIEQCKNELNLKDDYTAVELRAKPKVPVKPFVKPPRGIQLADGGRRPSQINPAPPATTAIMPQGSSLISVSPDGSRKIRIDPVSRRVPPVRVDL